MTEPYQRIETLRLSPELAARTRFYPEANIEILSTIECGVLFFIAFWSGPCFTALRKLEKVLKHIDAKGRLELVVVDIDCCDDLLRRLQIDLGGAGDCVWIYRGEVVATTAGKYPPDCFEDDTKRLLQQSDML